jgi:hypothetical protein
MQSRVITKTRHPGIYKLARPGKPNVYMVSYRIRGIGQRTKQFATLTEAKAFQATVRDPARGREMRLRARGTTTLSEYFAEWLPRKRNLAESTTARYEGVGRLYIQPGWFGALRLGDITRGEVEYWVSELAERCGPPTVDKVHRTLRACLNTAILV